MLGAEAIRRYWAEGAEQAQKHVRFGFTILATTDRTGIAHWTASFERVPSELAVQLDGILTAEFDESGRCTAFREWWHRREVARGSAHSG